MLTSLFGNKSVERALLYLFVHGKGYGTKLQRTFNTSLTPLQKAFQRLEKGGVLVSHLEGKTKLYTFNPSYPLLAELHDLLRKSYSLLPPPEKKAYCSPLSELSPKAIRKDQIELTLLNFWKRLTEVKKLTVQVKTKDSWQRSKGHAQVFVSSLQPGQLLFQEKGYWEDVSSQGIDFNNIFRWKLDLEKGCISLERLRQNFAKENALFLFHLTPTSKEMLSSIDAHLCGSDSYFGHLYSTPHTVHLKWRIIGPKKNEEIDYFYS